MTLLRGITLPLSLLVLASTASIGVIWLQSKPNALAAEYQPDFIKVELYNGQEMFVSRYEVTVKQWNACVSVGACEALTKHDQLDQDHPVTGVNWFDVQNYLSWYRSQTGTSVRLPSRQEWVELSGDHAPVKKQVLFTDPRLSWAANYDITAGPRDRVVKPTGSFGVNESGLSDFKGNVWEWTDSQCGDQVGNQQNCRSGRYAMGEHEAILSDLIRDPGNASCGAGLPPANLGFRLVYTSS